MSEFNLRFIYFNVKPRFCPFLMTSSGIWRGSVPYAMVAEPVEMRYWGVKMV